MSRQPNILLVMADQLAAQALSIYGNAVCKTPNLERLAAQGAVFT
jgi:choline-sulfatase